MAEQQIDRPVRIAPAYPTLADELLALDPGDTLTIRLDRGDLQVMRSRQCGFATVDIYSRIAPQTITDARIASLLADILRTQRRTMDKAAKR